MQRKRKEIKRTHTHHHMHVHTHTRARTNDTYIYKGICGLYKNYRPRERKNEGDFVIKGNDNDEDDEE